MSRSSTPVSDDDRRRDSGEMLFIGQRCNHNACSLVDFLPLKVNTASLKLCSCACTDFGIAIVPILPGTILLESLSRNNASMSGHAASSRPQPHSTHLPDLQRSAIHESRGGPQYRDEQAYSARMPRCEIAERRDEGVEGAQRKRRGLLEEELFESACGKDQVRGTSCLHVFKKVPS